MKSSSTQYSQGGKWLIVSLLVALCLFQGVCGRPKSSDEVETKEDDRPFCGEVEACKYGIVVRRSGANQHLSFKKVPTWCRCRDSQVCRNGGFNERSRTNIYYCRQPVRNNDRKFVFFV